MGSGTVAAVWNETEFRRTPLWKKDIAETHSMGDLEYLKRHQKRPARLAFENTNKKGKDMSKKKLGKFHVLFVAGFGPVVQEKTESHKFYLDTLGLSFQKDGDYLHTDEIKGVKHFALWPLSQAAQSCFGSESWPSDLPVPQAWL